MAENINDPDSIVAEALTQHRAGDLQSALEGYERALSRSPEHGEALHLKGVLLGQRGELPGALEFLGRAVAARPDDARILANRAKIHLDLGRSADAVADYRSAVLHRPDDPDLHFNLAGALAVAGQMDEAVFHLERACELNPDHARALANLGNLYRQLGRLQASRDVLVRAVAANPQDAEVQHSLGATLMDARDYDGAGVCFRRALSLDKGFVRAATQLFYNNLHACNWHEYDKLIGNFGRLIESGGALAAELSPLVALYLPLGQRALNAVSVARAQTFEPAAAPVRAQAVATSKLHIGYLSADLGQHPVGYLTADIFHRHDRGGFEVSAILPAPPDGSDVQHAVHEGVHNIIDVSRMSAEQAAGHLRESGLDILIDLGGFTRGARPEILALKPAPLQIGWLGYCGSAGGLNDVLLADNVVLPPDSGSHFPEALARLPGSFMPLNNYHTVGETTDKRSDHDLPESSFVFCAFNTPTKIDPKSFGCWMEILKQVPDSVLWLREHVDLTTENLRVAARQHGIDPVRLVFAPPVADMADHLARHRHADLFLDSFVYGAHSTAADAISMGLPVLTQAGAAMAARVGASLCQAYGLSALVVETDAAYTDLAVRLAKDDEPLQQHRAHLLERLDATRDSQAFVRKLEDAYSKLWQAKLKNELVPGRVFDLAAPGPWET